MSELRAPDPTLTGLGNTYVVVECRLGARIAHTLTWPRPHAVEWDYIEGAATAAYVAVPCRACFPDAPIPGVRRELRDDGRQWETGDPYLSWQTGGDV